MQNEDIPVERQSIDGMTNVNVAPSADRKFQADLKLVTPGKASACPNEKLLKKLRQFSSDYCSVFGANSMLKLATYYAYKVTSSVTGEPVGVVATSASVSGEVKVRVRQVSQESTVKSSGPVSRPGAGLSYGGAVELKNLPLDIPLAFNAEDLIVFSINSKLFSFSKHALLTQMLGEVSSDEDAMVSMSYDQQQDVFVIVADSGGKNSSVIISNIAGNAFGAGGAFKIDTGFYANGKNTVADIDGFHIESNCREYTHKGLMLTFHAETGAEGVKISIERDYDYTVGAIERFINELCSLSEELREDDTSSEFVQLSEEIVHILMNQEGGTGGKAKSFGIICEKASDQRAVPIIDINKLKLSLKMYTEEIVSLFSNNGTGSEMGIAHKVKECIGKYLTMYKTSLEAGSSNNSERANNRLDQFVEEYQKRYSQMQTASLIMERQQDAVTDILDPNKP